jgi:signal transduction histidine kinase/ActR/RegA family two-component response regulator
MTLFGEKDMNGEKWNKKSTVEAHTNDLRAQAEKFVQKVTEDLSDLTSEQIKELIHELKVHQIELEMQNESLQIARDQLEQTRDQYADLYNNAPVGYLSSNAFGVISRANETLAKMLNTNGANILNTNLGPWCKDEDAYYLHCRALQKKGGTLETEILLKRDDHTTLHVSVASKLIKTNPGNENEIRSIITDISERKRLENQLQHAQKMESIGNLAGGIAHDFNNILTSILGFTELALMEVNKGSNLEDNLQEVYTAGMRARDLVMQILTFARKSNEEVTLVHIEEVINQSIAFLRSSIPTNIIIHQDIQSDAQVICNPTLLEQIVLNLGTNAADAMENGGGTLTISVSDIVADELFASDNDLLGPGQHVQIKVSDTGVGIPDEVIKSIFEPYFTTKAPGRGTGMGLATVHGTAKKYGGAIHVESRLGKGTVVTVLLPSTHTHEQRRPYHPELLPHGCERILYVDDELPIVKMSQRLLEGLGYTVTARTRSDEALDLFKSKPYDFDLVVTDMTMPHMTGDKLAIELMRIRTNIPVILCTGYSKKISDESSAEMGIKAFAYKPIVKVDLAKTVRKVLDEAQVVTHAKSPYT